MLLRRKYFNHCNTQYLWERTEKIYFFGLINLNVTIIGLKKCKFVQYHCIGTNPWFNKFELNKNWTEEKQSRSIPLYLDESALIYCNSLLEQKKAKQQLAKQSFRTQYYNPVKQWQLRSELNTLP